MKFKTLMFTAVFGLSGTALADQHDKKEESSPQLEQPAQKAEQHADKAATEAEKAADAAREAQQPEMTAEQQQAAEREMESLMAEEIERRVEAAEQAPEKRVFGKVIGITEKQIILDIGGAALPVTVNHETKIEGQAIPRSKRIESHLRTEFQPGQLVSVAYDLKNMQNVALEVDELRQEAGQPSMGSQQQPMKKDMKQPSSERNLEEEGHMQKKDHMEKK